MAKNKTKKQTTNLGVWKESVLPLPVRLARRVTPLFLTGVSRLQCLHELWGSPGSAFTTLLQWDPYVSWSL